MRLYSLSSIAAIAGLSLATVLCTAQQPATTPANVSATMDESVATYRKIIVLNENADALDAGNRERVHTAAWILFEQNHTRLDQLEEALHNDAGKQTSPLVTAFLTRLENDANLRDADKLVFRDALDDLAHLTEQEVPSTVLRKRIADDADAMEQIQGHYQKEISQVFSGLQTRGMTVHREAWDDYVNFLKTKYTREGILKETESQLPPAESRGGAATRSKLEITGLELPPKTVVLSFDDGPHPRYTDQVLAILKKYGLHAVFFEIGKNLGTVNDKNEVTLGPTAAASYRVLSSGNALGNHTYSHPVLPKLDQAAFNKEVNTTSTLLNYVLKAPPVLFRPPYGPPSSPRSRPTR